MSLNNRTGRNAEENERLMPMTGFQLTTAILFFLTLLCIGINALGWVRVHGLYQVATGSVSTSTTAAEQKIAGVAQLTRLIRLEAVYYTLLFAYALSYPRALAPAPVVFVVLYHWLGWLINERTSATSRVALRLRQGGPATESFQGNIRRAIHIIGFLDAIEFVILGYIAFQTFPLM